MKMRLLVCSILLLVSASLGAWADTPPPQPVEGIIILKAVAGYPAISTPFVSIAWIDNVSGMLVDPAGNKLGFVNDAIGKILYFDEAYYAEVDHNAYWVDWRAGLQSREVVVAPIDTIGLHANDLSRLQAEQAQLQDIVDHNPDGKPTLDPMIATLNDDCAKLSSGLVLQNGTWLSASAADAASSAVPVVGDAEQQLTFTTKDGRKFANAKVTITDSGVSVITPDGGASLAFDQLPDDISAFPASARKDIDAARTKIADEKKREAEALAKATPPPAPAPPPPLTLWGTLTSYFNTAYQYVANLFSSSTPTTAVAAAPADASAPTPTRPIPAVATLSASAVVLIKGDYAQGTGFLAKTASGPVIFTNLHVLAANPNLKIYTSSGEQIVPLSMKGASDRDLAMLSIQDNHYTYLDLASSVDGTANVGDATIIPGDSEGGEVTLNTNGAVVGMGPQRVEFSNPIFHGNSGGPVFDVKTGKVIAVVVGATEMNPSDFVDKDSFSNANSAIKGSIRYFGYRLDTVPAWEDYDQGRFDQETLFLRAFHAQSMAIDSYINGSKYPAEGAENGEGWPPSAHYFLSNDKVRTINDNFQTTMTTHTKETAVNELLWALSSSVDENVDAVQNTSTFYQYNQVHAEQEYAYRKALKSELEHIRTKLNGVDLDNSGLHFGL